MNTIAFVGEHSRTYDVQWHSHDQWELVYCTGGDGTFKFENGSTIEYEEGQVVAIPPRERHANYSREGFTNLHIRMTDPSFPYRSAFRVEDDVESHLKMAFAEAKFYFLADMRKRELVLAALGELTVYDYTAPEDVIARIGDAPVILTNKTVITAEILAAKN